MRRPSDLNLTRGDYISLKTADSDFLVVTRTETRDTIKNILDEELSFFADETLKRNRALIVERIDKQIDKMNEDVIAYLEHRFDKVAEKVCDALITRKFQMEIDKKVEEKLKQRGRF